jgi:hypothetical protein
VDRLLVALPLAVAVGIVAIALWWRPHPGEPARLLTGTEACATVNFSNPQNGRLGMSVSFRRDDCRDPEPATAFEFFDCEDIPEWCYLEVTQDTFRRLVSIINSSRAESNDAPLDAWSGFLPITQESKSGVRKVVFIGSEATCNLLHEVLQLLPEKSRAARGFDNWIGNYAWYVGLSSERLTIFCSA